MSFTIVSGFWLQCFNGVGYVNGRIFYSLNWQEIPEYFEDHIKEWMGQFHKYLTYENPLLVDASEEEVSVKLV